MGSTDRIRQTAGCGSFPCQERGTELSRTHDHNSVKWYQLITEAFLTLISLHIPLSSPMLLHRQVLFRTPEGGARLAQVGGAKVLPGVTFTAKTGASLFLRAQTFYRSHIASSMESHAGV
jgi:hypothetical protein